MELIGFFIRQFAEYKFDKFGIVSFPFGKASINSSVNFG